MDELHNDETRDWSVRAVPVDVIRGLRVFAVSNDLTMAEALTGCYDAYLGDDDDEEA